MPLLVADDIASISRDTLGGVQGDIASWESPVETEVISLTNPIEVKKPKESTVTLVGTQVGDCQLGFGLKLSMLHYADTDMVLWADGVNPIRLLNNNGCFDVSVVAPQAALAAVDVAVDSTIRPVANLCGVQASLGPPVVYFCGEGDESSNTQCAPRWFDSSGTEHNSTTDPSNYICHQWKAVSELTTDDTGRIRFEGRFSGCRSRLKFGTPSFTPSVDTGHSVLFRIRRSVVGNPVGAGRTMSLVVRLMQGHSTTIKSTSFVYGDLTDQFVDHTMSLSASEAALITDYTDLRLYVELDQTIADASNYYIVDLSFVEMTVPTAGAGFATGVYSYVYTYVRSATGCESGPSPVLTHTHGTTGCVCLHDILLSQDPTVDFINIYRTDVNGGEYFLIATIPNVNDGDVVELCGGTDVVGEDILTYAPAIPDCTSDVDLTDDGAVILQVQDKRVYGSGLPPRVRFLVSHQNKVFGAGALYDAPYTARTADFTNGSTVVTGIGTLWTSRLEGRLIKVAGQPDSEFYKVAKVHDIDTLELTTPFAQATAAASLYTVEDIDRSAQTLYYSQEGKPEDWPVTNAINFEADTPDGITGLCVYFGRLLVFTKSSIYELVGTDALSYSVYPIYRGVGCVSHFTIQLIGQTVYFQGEQGYYAFDGSQARLVSNLPAFGKVYNEGSQNGQISGVDRTVKALNYSRFPRNVSLWDHRYNLVMNFGARALTNCEALCYCLNSGGSWSVDDAPDVVTAALVYDQSNSETYLLGGLMGDIWQMGAGNSDGVFAGTIVASVTSASSLVITCSGASFDTVDGLFACPVYLVDQHGNYVRLKAASNTPTTLTLLFPLPFIPDSTYKVVVGGIPMELETGWLDFASVHKPVNVQFAEVSYEPQDEGRLFMRKATSFGPLVLDDDSVDLSRSVGTQKVYVRTKARHTKVKFFSLVPGNPIRISRIDYTLGVSPGAEK